MPTPEAGESERDYISRCIPVVLHEGTAKDGKQAAAICYSMYDEHHKAKGKAEMSRVFQMDRSSGAGGGFFFRNRYGKVVHATPGSGKGKGEQPDPLAAGPEVLGLAGPRKRTGIVREVAQEAQSARGLGKLTLDTDENGNVDPHLVEAYRRHLEATGHVLGEFQVNPTTQTATAEVTHPGITRPGGGGLPAPAAKFPSKAFVKPAAPAPAGSQSFMPGLNAAKVAIEGRIGALKEKLAQTKGGGKAPATLESLDKPTPARPMGTLKGQSQGIFRKLPDGRTIFIPGHKVRGAKPVSPVTPATPKGSAPPEPPLIQAAKSADADLKVRQQAQKSKLESMADAAIRHVQTHPESGSDSIVAAVGAQARAHGEELQHPAARATEPQKPAAPAKAPEPPPAQEKPVESKPEPSLREFKAKVKADAKAREAAKAAEQAKTPKEPQREGLQSIRQQIHDYYKESGGGLPHHIQQELENMRAAFVVYKGSPRYSEFKQMEQEGGVINSKGGIQFTDNPREAGAEDAIGELTDKYGHHGDEYYRQAFRERSGLGFQDALEHTRQAAAAGDDRAKWLVRLHDQYTPGKKDVVSADTLKLDDHAKLHGEPLKVTLNEDGEKVVQDGGTFPTVPLSDLHGVKLPLDKGSLHHQEPDLPPAKAAQAPVNHAELIAEHKRLSAQADEIRSLSANFADSYTLHGGGPERTSPAPSHVEKLRPIYARQREIESVVGPEAVYGKQFKPLGEAQIRGEIAAHQSSKVSRNPAEAPDFQLHDPHTGKMTDAGLRNAAEQARFLEKNPLPNTVPGLKQTGTQIRRSIAARPGTTESLPHLRGANASEVAAAHDRRAEVLPKMESWVTSLENSNHPKAKLLRGQLEQLKRSREAEHWLAPKGGDRPAYDPHGIGAAMRKERERYGIPFSRSLTMSRGGQGYFFKNKEGKTVFASGQKQGGLFDPSKYKLAAPPAVEKVKPQFDPIHTTPFQFGEKAAETLPPGLPHVDTSKLPTGSKVRVVHMEPRAASEPGSPFPRPELGPRHQMEVTIPADKVTREHEQHMKSIGLKSMYREPGRFLSDVHPTPEPTAAAPRDFSHIPPLSHGEGSWVVSHKATGKVIGEFFDRKNVEKFNPEKVSVATIGQHLRSVNAKIAAAATPKPGDIVPAGTGDPKYATPEAVVARLHATDKKIADLTEKAKALELQGKPAGHVHRAIYSRKSEIERKVRAAGPRSKPGTQSGGFTMSRSPRFARAPDGRLRFFAA